MDILTLLKTLTEQLDRNQLPKAISERIAKAYSCSVSRLEIYDIALKYDCGEYYISFEMPNGYDGLDTFSIKVSEIIQMIGE